MAINKDYTELKTSRFERKFVIERGGVPFVEQIVKMNNGGFRPVFYERQINNIYFDTPNLRNYYDNHFGKSKRVKIRIRWYGETFGKIENPILEFKIKTAATGRKLSFKLSSFTLHENISKHELQLMFSKSDIPDWVKNEVSYFIPTLVNTYQRKYYVSFDNLFRFTIDHHMEYYNIKTSNHTFVEKSSQEGLVVLELKYDMENDSKVRGITSTLPFRLNKFSKYVNGIESFNNHLAV
ncbi:MAG: VTC domain-containing protein [Bacteroidales bacterium]|nr:VTC domain-containing protein [Bacteroidales bacterium]